ncbi:MAG: hypothetical protein H0X27_08620 [Caulobacteraceae bacterium]|nr:hypothetical protein [Caulobacteraceae bacterium]
MTIGTPIALGSANAASGSLTLNLTTTADSPAGATIVVFIASGNTATINSVTDVAGNTYTAGNSLSSGSTKQNIYYCINALALLTGGTITGTWAAATGSKMLGATSVSGVLGKDQEPVGTTGTGTAPAITSDVLGLSGEIIFAQAVAVGGAGDAFTEDAAFTTAGSAANGSAMHWAYKASADLFPVAYGPSLGTSRVWGAKMLALKGAAVVPPGSKGAATTPKFGIFCSGDEYLRLGRNLGVQYQRMNVNNTAGANIGSDQAAAIRDLGIGINLILNNAATTPSSPPADIPTYQSQVAAILDNIRPDLVNIQIEIDAGVFYQSQATAAATATAYLAQLKAAADVCHSTGAYVGQNRHYLIGDSGISSSGTNFAYWNYLWGLGDHSPGNAADVFKAVGLIGPSQGVDGTDARDQVPDAANPTRGIFATAGQADRLTQLTLVNLLLSGLKATGIDYINVHAFWYFNDFSLKQDAVQWVIDTVGLPAMTNAWGQRDRDPQTTRAMYAAARKLRMNWLFWYSVYQKKAQDPGDEDGDLTILGTALRDAVNPQAWMIGRSASASYAIGGLAPAPPPSAPP